MNVPEAVEKVAPLWSQRLKTENIYDLVDGKEIHGHDLNIASSSCCIVGEAWGFDYLYSHDDELDCNQCCNLAADFMHGVFSEDERRLQEDLYEFDEHVKQRHEKLLRK